MLFLEERPYTEVTCKKPRRANRRHGGFDTLTEQPCAGAVPSRHSFRRSCCVAPNIGGCGPKPPMSGTADQVSLHIECVVDRGMHRPEPLSQFGGLETLHLSLASPERLGGVFFSVVGPATLLVAA